MQGTIEKFFSGAVTMTRLLIGSVLVLAALSVSAPAAVRAAEPKPSKADSKEATKLFDGKTLGGWKSTNFGGEGDVKVEKGQIVLEMGQPLTGITYQQADKLPKDNYEISLQAMKIKGDDFFCGLTFPVGDSHASFIVGGWAGTVVGLSNINDLDASENETTQYLKFDHDKWYKIRVRVAAGKIQAWIDDKEVVDVDRQDKKIGTRPEVDPSKPLGIAVYQVKAAVKDITLRKNAVSDKGASRK
jgi:hypothetical protein